MADCVSLWQENPDLFKWLTGQLQPPEEVADNIAYKVCVMCLPLAGPCYALSG